jgi:hypothetical protein
MVGRRCCAAFWLTSRSALPNWRFGLRWQAERDTALGVANQPVVQHPAKAPSPLRFAGALQEGVGSRRFFQNRSNRANVD